MMTYREHIKAHPLWEGRPYKEDKNLPAIKKEEIDMCLSCSAEKCNGTCSKVAQMRRKRKKEDV